MFDISQIMYYELNPNPADSKGFILTFYDKDKNLLNPKESIVEGDLITHKDQSFERSVYKFIKEIKSEKELLDNQLMIGSITRGMVKDLKDKYPVSLLEMYAFNGHLFEPGEIIVHENIRNFRIARSSEIEFKIRKGLLKKDAHE